MSRGERSKPIVNHFILIQIFQRWYVYPPPLEYIFKEPLLLPPLVFIPIPPLDVWGNWFLLGVNLGFGVL